MSPVKPQVKGVDLVAKLQPQGSRRVPRLNFDKLILRKLQKLERIFGLQPGNDFFFAEAVLLPDQIPLCPSLVRRHPLGKFIRSALPISHQDLSAILSNLQFEIHLYDTGTIPAGLNPASDYAQHAWTRDAAIVAIALAMTRHPNESRKAMSNIACFYGREEQRSRFIGFHYDNDPAAKYRYGNPNRDLPHIRARIDESGNMIESEQDWSHSQLDAIGMWLYATFWLANRNLLDLKAIDHLITADINPDNGIDSIYSVALKFLNRIRFWEQHDHGPWEDRLEPSRASSVGICVAALKEALAYFERNNWDTFQIYNPEGGPSLREELSTGLIEGERVLTARIPKSGSAAVETERYPSDSALAFLLFPFNPGLSGTQERAILSALYRDRMGEVGFTRRDNDEYLGMDYPINESGCFCDISKEGYKAAEWTLFDPLISAYYFQRYLSSSGMDEASFLLGERHLKRSLAQITKSKDSYVKVYDSCKVEIPAMRLPEAYWFESSSKKWRANENTPLLMAEAASAMMFERGIEASKLWETARARSKSAKKGRAI
ncbi:MAG: hypothetical protein J5J00_06295 [Deltaproteobacteria bacterium]|nr:hypothetical protein [Deltaproteobacteria bacterium]